MNFKQITNLDLDNIDLSSLSLKIDNIEYINYFISKSSIEHYRLMSYISLNNDGIKILDIGTLKGCSALALSINKNNEVNSFNLHDELQLNSIPTNINFYIDDILNSKYLNLILDSKYILLDTFHDGTFELIFLEYLKKIGYKGYLLLDDIKLNKDMVDFWNNIDIEKSDISHLGHITGTGVVYFN
jgi:hypothetical protein